MASRGLAVSSWMFFGLLAQAILKAIEQPETLNGQNNLVDKILDKYT